MFSAIRNKRNWLLVITAALGMAVSVSAQAIQGTDTGMGGVNSITGTVLSPAGQRIPGRVSIRLASSTRGDRVAVTDDYGNFGFRGLPNGDYMLVIDKEKEFEPFVQNVNVFQMRGTPGQNVMVSIRLKHKAGIPPKPGVVNAEFAGVPANALASYKKATDLAANNDHKGAIEHLKKAIAAHPQFSAAYNDMGVQYLKMKDLGRADDAFISAMNIDKNAYAPMLNHGMIMYDIKRYDLAEPVFRDVVKLKSDSAVGHFFLGQTLANLGRFDEAEKELVEALSIGGESMAVPFKEAHRLLAIIYSTRGDKKRQATELETYLKLAPTAPDAEKLKELIQQLKETS